MKHLSTWLLPVLLVSCSPSSSTPARTDGMVIEASPSQSASVPRPDPVQAATVTASAIARGWEGAPCEGRAYVRLLSLDNDGTFMATDRVAPCPRGAMCTWSGIILWKGTWHLEDHRVILSADRSTRLPDVVPEALLVADGARALSELPGSTCRYIPAP